MLIGSNRPFRVFCVIALAVCLLAAGRCVRAQVESGVEVRVGVGVVAVKADAPKAEAATTDLKKSTVPGTTRAVFFNEDRELGARLRKAAQLRLAGKLQQAFDLYLWVLESGDEVMFRLDDNRFCDVRDYCMRHIAALPKEYLTQYRLLTDAEVARLFDEMKETPDPEALASLALRYFLSTHGPEVLDYAGDVYAGQGAFPQAASCWRRVLKWGGEGVSRTVIETKLALALSRYGDLREAREVTSTLKTRDATARVTLGGREEPVVAFLERVLPKAGELVRRSEVKRDHWPQFGGDGGHDANMPADFKCDVKVGELIVPGYDWKVPARATPRRVSYRATSIRQRTVYSPFVPIYASGKVFIHDDKGVMAFRLNALRESWTVGEMSVSGNAAARRSISWAGGMRAYVCAWADGVVYASLGKAASGREVWAVSDRGKVLWRATKEQVGLEWLGSTTALSDPVLLDGSVFVCAWQGGQWRHDFSLVSLDAATGRLNWRRFICSGAKMPAYYYGRYLGVQPSLNVPAAADGVVVACSDLGGIAAVDARSGDVLWGFAYEQRGVDRRRMMIQARGQTTPSAACTSSTPVVHEGIVYVTPQDSSGLYAIDLTTGRCLWRKVRGSYGTIVGISGRHVILSGKEVAALDTFTGEVAWTHDIDTIGSTGRGFITSDAVYIPGRKAIYRFDPASGKVLGRLLVDPDKEEFGNLLLVEDTMVQMGRRANFYGLWERVYAKLEGQIRRNPRDPEPHGRLGAIYARKEARVSAIRSYERALELLVAGKDTTEAAREREEVRKRLYDLYTVEIKQALKDNRTDRALTLARRNVNYATTDHRRIAVVNALIEVYTQRGDWRNVVRQYQSFLLHPPKTVYAFGGDSEMLPALYARLKIGELIVAHGRKVYAEFDAAASKLASKASREALEKVVRVYPNATSTLRALVKLAEREAAVGQFRKASRTLAEYLRLAGKDATDVVRVRWRLATYRERDGQLASARRLFERLAEKHGDARVPGTSTRRTIRAAVTERLKRKIYVDNDRRRTLPKFRAPLRQRVKLSVGARYVEITDDGAILALDSRGVLRCLEGHDRKVRWNARIDVVYITGTRFINDRLMICGRKTAKLINSDTGKMLWSYNAGNPIGRALQRRVGAVLIVGGDFDDRYVALNTGGARHELLLLDADAGGKLVWKKKLPVSPVFSPVLWQDRVAVTTVSGVSVFDVQTGEQVFQMRVQRPSRPAFVLDDGRLYVATRTTLECIDLAARKRLWSRPFRLYNRNYMTSNDVVRVNGKDCFVGVTTDRKVVCVDLESGKALWSKTVGAARDRLMGVRVADDAVCVLVLRSSGTERLARVVQFKLDTGETQWTSDPLGIEVKEGTLMANARSWVVSRESVVVLVDMWARKKVGRGWRSQPMNPMVLCVERAGGKIVQRLTMKYAGGGAGRNRPHRLVATDDTVWVVYHDIMLGLRGP